MQALTQFTSVALALTLAALPARAGDPDEVARVRESVAFDQKLGSAIDRELVFLDETAREVRLGDYFQGKPVLLVPVYYTCPMLCTQVLNGLVDGLRTVTLEPGQDYEIVVYSIDPTNDPAVAAEKKANYLERLGRHGTEAGWHFLSASPRNALPATERGEPKNSAIDALSQSLGFRYGYDAEIKQYAHAGGIVIATPDGKLSKYLYGIEFSPRDLRLALIDSSEGKISKSVADRFLWLCYHYDPLTGKYSFAVMNVVRGMGLLTALGLIGYLVHNLVRERRLRHLEAGG